MSVCVCVYIYMCVYEYIYIYIYVCVNLILIFLNLIKKHFPLNHKFHKLFNKNTVKISHSCTRNIKSIINSHNAKILFPKKNTEQRTCNCLNKVNRPLEEKWLTTNIVYKAKITSSNQNYQENVYFGSCETTFKKDSQITKSHLI